MTKMTKRIASFIPLLLLFAAITGSGGDRPQDSGQRSALGSLGAPLQANDASSLTAPEQTTRKSGPKQALAAILDGRVLHGYIPSVAWIRRLDFAPRPELPVAGARSIRAPPVSVLAL